MSYDKRWIIMLTTNVRHKGEQKAAYRRAKNGQESIQMVGEHYVEILRKIITQKNNKL